MVEQILKRGMKPGVAFLYVKKVDNTITNRDTVNKCRYENREALLEQ